MTVDQHFEPIRSLQVDQMPVLIFESNEALGARAADDLADGGPIQLKAARHPLLEKALRESGGEIVPVEMELGADVFIAVVPQEPAAHPQMRPQAAFRG